LDINKNYIEMHGQQNIKCDNVTRLEPGKFIYLFVYSLLIILTVREIIIQHGESGRYQGSVDFDKTATSFDAAKSGVFNIQQPNSTESILAFI
jgi:hypothetical protein